MVEEAARADAIDGDLIVGGGRAAAMGGVILFFWGSLLELLRRNHPSILGLRHVGNPANPIISRHVYSNTILLVYLCNYVRPSRRVAAGEFAGCKLGRLILT